MTAGGAGNHQAPEVTGCRSNKMPGQVNLDGVHPLVLTERQIHVRSKIAGMLLVAMIAGGSLGVTACSSSDDSNSGSESVNDATQQAQDKIDSATQDAKEAVDSANDAANQAKDAVNSVSGGGN